ncbi:MAG TPA: RNA 2',3'-cyclic phosphodiesterase [Gemmatimonadales bacterium]
MRLFVAVNFPEPLRAALWDAALPLRQRRYPVKWVGPESLHLTVKFLGAVDEARERAVTGALADATRGVKAFHLGLEGFGAFPSADQPRVVWAGCDAAPPLELLHHDVERLMAAQGFPVEGRPFRPHVTLGRVRDGATAREFEALASQLADLSFRGEAMVSSVDLMQSTLSPAGSVYVLRHAAPLAA